MNCQEFWNSIPQRGPISGEQSDHLTDCAACAAAWEPHHRLSKELQALGEQWRTEEAPPRVEAGLMAAFRSQAGYGIPRLLGRSWWTPVFAWATAAAAMVVMAVVLVRGYQPAPSPGTVAAPRHASRPVVQLADATADADSDDDASILGDGFVRLPNTPRIDSSEDFNVVRVEVPGSAMIAMGVSVSEDQAADKLVADVALGPDGTARAVRLVSGGGTM